MDHKDLLLEVGTEEIPAAFLPDALAALKDKAEKALQSQRIAFNEISTVGTPRRLALLATGVAVSQEELVVTKIGPAKSIAFDKDGNPTKSAIGFAKGQGIDIAEIKTVQTDKGEYICAEKKRRANRPSPFCPGFFPKLSSLFRFANPCAGMTLICALPGPFTGCWRSSAKKQCLSSLAMSNQAT